MAVLLNPYIAFTGQARQAMTFYAEVLGGTLTMTTFGDFGQANSPFADQIMHAQLVTPAGITLMASDTPPGMERTPGNTISLSLSGDDEPVLRGYWDKLIDGADVSLPLERQMWGDLFGQCTDKFGINWMVNIAAANS
jgi:PhnB protein